ncbi:MAG: tyrosine-type recombinase/integrase, partial [Planctomycetota bacterium]
IYLGPYDSPESRARYHELIAEWEMSGRVLPPPPETISVAEIARQYLKWARTYYVKNGHLTAEPDNITLALRPMLKLFAKLPACEFGPKRLKLVRQEMVGLGWSRRYINKHVERIRRMFKWAVADELVPSGAYEALRAVSGLRYGRCGAHDYPPVQPVPEELIGPVKRHVARQVAAMIDLQLLTGARPGEIVQMRPCDVERSEAIWTYRPAEHKTQHHGHDRVIFLGPKAQEVLMPFLLREAEAFCFSPAEAERERYAALAERSPNGGRRVGKNCRTKPAHQPGPCYTVDSYRRAITRGQDAAFPPPAPLAKRDDETWKKYHARLKPKHKEEIKAWRKEHHWHPHQLRHNYATNVRREFGLEAAQVLLGHAKADVTQIYAERDLHRAAAVAAKIG